MKIGGELVHKWVSSLPSLFDVVVCGYLLFISFWTNGYETRLAFNLGIIFMLSMTLAIKPIREYKSLPLALMAMWTFYSIFLHSYKPNYTHESIVFKYLNIFVLSEGFIYVFSGAFLFYLVVKYSKSLIPYIITLLICLIPYFKSAVYHGKMATIVSLSLAILIYSIMNRKWLITKITTSLIGLGCLAIYLKWLFPGVPDWCLQEARNVIYYKFACRPYIWIQLFRDMKDHWIVGNGFPHYLGIPNMFWVGKIGNVEQGWLFRHNDYFGIGVYLGIISILLIGWFIVGNIIKIRKTPWVIGLLTISLIPFFSCTMFDVYKASVILVIGALCVRKGIYG